MAMYQYKSDTLYHVYTKPVFAHEAYFSSRVTLKVDKNGKKTFQFGFRVVPLKTIRMELKFHFHVSTRRKIIGKNTGKLSEKFSGETVTMQYAGEDFVPFLYKASYDYVDCGQLKIVLGDIKMDAYDRKNYYETLNFSIALPTKNNYEESLKDPWQKLNYKAYRNSSPKKTLKGLPFYVTCDLRIKKENSSRVRPEEEKKWPYKDDQVYAVFTHIEHDDKSIIGREWSMIVRNMDGKVLFAKSYRNSYENDYDNFLYDSSIPVIPIIRNEKELYVSVIIKSLCIKYCWKIGSSQSYWE